MDKYLKNLIIDVVKEFELKDGFNVLDINILSFNKQNIQIMYQTEKDGNIFKNVWNYTGDIAEYIFNTFDNFK